MGRTKFNLNWLKLRDLNDVEYGDYIKYDQVNINTITEVLCDICNWPIVFENRGVTALRDHSKNVKHRNLSAIRQSSAQLRLTKTTTKPAAVEAGEGPSKSLKLFVKDEETLQKEILWTIHAVVKNSSFNSAEKDGAVLRLIASNDLGKISLTRQKMTHLTNQAIGPFFKAQFLADVKDQYYSALYDESDSPNKSKELAILVKYYSPATRQLQIFHLECVFIGKATADILHAKIKEALKQNQLSLTKLVMVSNDGPNVTKAVTRKVNSDLITERGYGLI